MSERRFYLREQVNEAEIDYPEYTVTESELKDRLTAIRAILSGDYPTPYKLDKAICVMLHGKKQPLLTPQEAAQFKQTEVDRLSDELSKNHTKLHGEQPDEWEEWIQRMPKTIDYVEWYEWADKFTEWFREMPRRKP